jgi:hypothetical protein
VAGDLTYVVSDGEFLKIGRATDAAKRIASLQTGNPRRLVLLGVVARNIEQRIHECLGLRGVQRHVGEWFDDNAVARDLLARAGLLDSSWRIDGYVAGGA